jgi:outer membrane protein
MKIMSNFVVLAIVSLGAGTAHAAKYGLIDIQSVIQNVDDGKVARIDLEKKIKAKEIEFNKRRDEMDKMNKDWQAQSSLMSEEARMNKQKEFQEKFLALRNDEQTFREGIKQDEQKATQQIAAKVETIVQKIAKDKGLDVVFEANSAGLLYLEKPVELTKEVIEIYSKKK